MFNYNNTKQSKKIDKYQYNLLKKYFIFYN